MKVAISSASFAHVLTTGELTQLEWLERCASALAVDGVVFESAHFARTDADYVAQLKKVTVDVGLVPLALSEPALFDAALSDDERRAVIEVAAQLGAFFVIAGLPAPGEVPPATFVQAVGAAKLAVAAAKRWNITLLVKPGAGTLAPDAPALRHFVKDVDSAWLRYALPASPGRDGLRGRDRVLVMIVEPDADLDLLVEAADAARPWLLLAGSVDAERIARLRSAAAKKTLAIAGV